MADITKNPIFTDEAAARAHLRASAGRTASSACIAVPTATPFPLSRKQARAASRRPRASATSPPAVAATTARTAKARSPSRSAPSWRTATSRCTSGCYAFHLMLSSKKGISSHQLHRTLGVSYKTAWFMSHRIREALRSGFLAPPMGGAGKIVEADETFIGRKQGAAEGARLPPQDGRADADRPRDAARPAASMSTRPTARTSCPSCAPTSPRKRAVVTDEAAHYTRSEAHATTTPRVNHSATRNGSLASTTPTRSKATSRIFKRGMKGVYQHCCEKHLHRYLAEFDFRYSNRVRPWRRRRQAHGSRACAASKASASPIGGLVGPDPKQEARRRKRQRASRRAPALS